MCPPEDWTPKERPQHPSQFEGARLASPAAARASPASRALAMSAICVWTSSTFTCFAFRMAAPARQPMKTAAAPMPRAQRYKVERRAGAVVAASSFSLALLELWAPLAAALLRAALLAWGSTADAVTCTAERATRVIDCMINSRRHYRAAKLPNTPDRCLVARNQTCWYCNKTLSQVDATS